MLRGFSWYSKKKTNVKHSGVLGIILLQHGNFQAISYPWKFWTEHSGLPAVYNFPEAAKTEAWEENLMDLFEFVARKWAELPLCTSTEAQIPMPVGRRPSHRDGKGLQAVTLPIPHNQRQICSSAPYISVCETQSVVPAGVTARSRERDLVISYRLWSSS